MSNAARGLIVRHRHYPLIVATLLAGCGGPPVANQQQVDETTNRVAPEPPSLPPPVSTPAAAPTPGPSPAANPEPASAEPPAAQPVADDAAIPARFQGRYAFDARGCARRGSEGQLVVDPGGLRFYESVGAATRVEPLDGGAIRVTARYTGEGESWTATHRLALSGGERLTVTDGEGHAVARVRCGVR